MKNLVIIGAGKIAEEIYLYLKGDSDYIVAGFSAEKSFINKDSLFGLPVVSFESLTETFPQDNFNLLTAMGYQDVNRLRTRLYLEGKSLGYNFVSYVSSSVKNINDLQIGENCIVLENNTINNTAKIGNNVVLWCGNHVGHHSIVEDNCFLAGGCAVSGITEIGKNTFVGVNATIGHQLRIGENNIIGAGSRITKSTDNDSVYIAQDTAKYRLDTASFSKITKL